MENIEESQSITVRTGNGKVLMIIAGVLAVMLLLPYFFNFNFGIFNYFDMYTIVYFSEMVSAIALVLVSVGLIFNKSQLFKICNLIIIAMNLAQLSLYVIRLVWCYDSYIAKLDFASFFDELVKPIAVQLCLVLSFVILFLLFVAQKKNNNRLITIGKCVFVIPIIAFVALHHIYLIEIYYFFKNPLLNGDYFMDLLYFLQQILLIAAILLLSLSLIITPKELNIPASSTAYGKSYKSLVPHVLLLLFTCGIYYLVWIYRTTDSLNACKNEEYRTPVNKLLLCMFVPFYSIYWTYKSAHRIDMLGYEKGIQGDTATLNLILSLFVPILPPILMQSKLNSVIMADSASPAVATAMQYAAKPVDNGYNDLEKLKELYDKGIITEEEFTEKKKQVLGI